MILGSQITVREEIKHYPSIVHKSTCNYFPFERKVYIYIYEEEM